MTINQAQFAQVVEAAKAAASAHPSWLRAIEKAAAAILSGEMIVTTLAHGALVTTANGTYRANGLCECPARTRHCYHRAGARLMERYEAAQVLATRAATSADVTTTASIEIAGDFAADVATSSRENLIAEIKNIFPRACPGVNLADALMTRFRKNQLEMLDVDTLRRVRLAIAI